MTSNSSDAFDQTVDVLVIGSGGGGMTAALTAHASGLDTLVVEKSPQFGGSTALSGGGIWVPGAPSQRKEGYVPDPDAVFEYLRQITGGLVSDSRLRQYVDTAPEMMEFLEKSSGWFEFVWKPGYADYYPELPGGSELGSTINVPAIDLRKLGDEEQNLLQPLALAPKGIWFAPKDLRLFYQVRQNWRGKAVLVKLIWRMFRARVFGDRMAAIGQSLAARLRLAMKEHDIPLWLSSPMIELITDLDGTVTGAVVEKDGRPRRIAARHGVILASGGFDHDMAWRKQHLCPPGRSEKKDWSFGNPAAMGDGIRAGEKVGGSTDLLDEAWWFPAICWPDGRLQFMLNERMMPCAVRGERRREAVHQRGGALHGLRARDDRGTEAPVSRTSRAGSSPTSAHSTGTWSPATCPSRRCRSLRCPPGGRCRRPGWSPASSRRPTAGRNSPAPSTCPLTTSARPPRASTNWRATGHDDDFNRGDSAYDNYYGDPTLPNPNLHPLGKPPYYAFQIILGDLGTSGGLRTDEYARVLRSDDSVVKGLYAVGNCSAAVMGRSYAGAGATIGPAMTFGYVAAKHIADQSPGTGTQAGTQTDSTLDSHRKVTK